MGADHDDRVGGAPGDLRQRAAATRRDGGRHAEPAEDLHDRLAPGAIVLNVESGSLKQVTLDFGG